jgi:lysophospholipase L1-like esterase
MPVSIRLWGLLFITLLLTGGVASSQEPAKDLPWNQDPTRWTEVIKGFERDDVAAPPPANVIVFTGSSSIAFWHTVRDDMAPLQVVNRGFGGSTMKEALFWLDPLVLKYKPQAVVLYEGDNDIGLYNLSPESIRDGFLEFVKRVHAELPATRIYFLAIKPSIARWNLWPQMSRTNDLIRDICKQQRNLHFIDIATPMLDEHGKPHADLFDIDNLHLNAKGYALWTSVVKPILVEREGPAQLKCDRSRGAAPSACRS